MCHVFSLLNIITALQYDATLIIHLPLHTKKTYEKVCLQIRAVFFFVLITNGYKNCKRSTRMLLMVRYWSVHMEFRHAGTDTIYVGV